MELKKMNAKTRTDITKPAKKALRKDGFVPSVLYGGDDECINVALNEKIWQKLFEEKGSRNLILDLILDDKAEDIELIKVGQVQRHPIKANLLHVDLIRLARGVAVTFDVPIRFIGKAEGEKSGGMVMRHEDHLDVECFPRDVPDVIEIDITEFELNQGMRVSELPWDLENVKILTDADRLIFTIEVPKVKEEAVVKEVEEGEEGEEGVEGEEGKEGKEDKKDDKSDDDKKKK